MYEVKSIPIPKTRRPGQRRYHFDQIRKVGESIQIPLEDFKTPDAKKAVNTVRSALTHWRKSQPHNNRYTVRSHAIDGKVHVGVWLLEKRT